MTGKWIYILPLLLISGFDVGPVKAQDISINSKVDRTTVPLNGSLALSVTISGSDANRAGEPQLSSIPEFSVRRTGTSSSIEIINFKTSMAVTYSYLLVPSKTGTFDVGEAYVTVDGKRYSAKPVTVTVTDAQSAAPNQNASPSTGSTSSDNDDEIFVVGSVDKKTVYVGEQITFTFELYNRRTITDIEYEAPATTGFWTVDLPKTPATLKMHGQWQYNYNAVKSALFPTTAGELTIGQASVTFYPQMSFFATGPAQRIATDPIHIRVKPLPTEGNPAGFNGAVGNYRISATTEQDTVRVGDVVSITVSVTGDGNLDLVTSVNEPDFTSFRTYPPRVVETIRNSGNTIGGVKIWEYMIASRQQGSVTVTPFTIAYFNPDDESFHTASTQPITLTVLPGSPADTDASSPDTRRDSMTKVATDIRYLKPDKSELKSVSRNIYMSWMFPLAYIIPAFVLIGSAFYRKRRDTIERNSGLRRKLNAWKHAQQRLRQARSLAAGNDVTGFCGTLHECVTAFIGDMFNIDTGALTVTGLEQLLRENGVPAGQASEIRKTLEMCDFVRFASVGSGDEMRDTLLTDTARHLAKLREFL